MPALSQISTDVQAITKTYYATQAASLTFKNRPAMGMLPKSTDGGGDYFKVPITIAGGAGTSPLFATAKANASNSIKRAFLVDWYEHFTVTTLNNTNIELCKGDKKAILNYVTSEVDEHWNVQANRIEQMLFASGYGEIGQIATGGVSSATITLANRAQHINFWKGLRVVFAAALDTGALRNNAGNTVLTVSSVNRSAGTVTFTANVSTVSGAALDFVFPEGARQDTGSPTKRLPAGFKGILPLTDPSASESFYGVDRSVDRDMLAGIKVNATGASITEAINDTMARLGEQEGNPDLILMHTSTLNKLTKELQNKGGFDFKDFKGKNIPLTFRGIEVPGANGTAVVLASAYCDTDRFYSLQTDTWMIKSVGELIRNPLHAGTMMDQESADGVEIRNKSLWAVGCNAPGRNAVTQIA